MAQTALVVLFASIVGILVIVWRRLPQIAALPVARKKKETSMRQAAQERGITLVKGTLFFLRSAVMWVIHFSLEKTLRKARIFALKIENYATRKLEEMRAHSREMPHFSFVEIMEKRKEKTVARQSPTQNNEKREVFLPASSAPVLLEGSPKQRPSRKERTHSAKNEKKDKKTSTTFASPVSSVAIDESSKKEDNKMDGGSINGPE